ncbi:AraC family transcriptional regulator [Kitasatospora sp. NBC_00240]|uniref:helix-turn-helix domain-containing protein n=1 Tax=Kitasatospora sp. NBC_00240 TaxID=2903567 RepID=UPI002254564F|nr:AraC family transcriptional regulator [Kitasatospora sp. NBC_00240]MCX5212028.1 AraC family transcriptional regulator [Kitasatospora sp. NBC_00240]
MCRPGWHRARIAAQHLNDLARLRRVRDRIDREYEQPLDVVALARSVEMPAGQLGREFRLAYGRSPYAYLTARRIEHAKALLRCGDLGAAEVWSAVGCASPGVFSARFTELVGLPPAAFRHRAAGPAVGLPPRPAEHRSGPVRNREALASEPQPA